MSNLVIGTSYTFSTYAPSILSAVYSAVKLVSIVDYETACALSNVDQTQRAVASMLPSTTSTDITGYTFYVFKVSESKKVVLASEWLDLSTVVVSNAKTAVFTVPNVTASNISAISNTLTLMGFNGVTVVTK